jgi:hypothetical protein
MPIVFTYKGYRFFFFSNEGDPHEPIHIHVRKESKLAQFWLGPPVQLAESRGFPAKELNRIVKMIDNRRNEIEEAWDEYFNA